MLRGRERDRSGKLTDQRAEGKLILDHAHRHIPEMDAPKLLADFELSCRLENAEGEASTRFVEARARLFPGAGYEWRRFGSVRAMFDGAESPITQTFGLGLGDPQNDRASMSEIERFFDERSAPVFHEVSPLADSEVVDELVERGYRPLEFTSVMYLPLGAEPMADRVRAVERFEVRAISEGEGPLWADVSVRGWSAEHPEYEEYLRDLAPISTGRWGAISVLAFLDGEPVAAGSMSLHDGVLLLAGACTVPEARRQGAQRALLRYRLAYARDNGCDVAMMCAQPGSASQRNAERQGFRIAYTRIKWGRSELA